MRNPRKRRISAGTVVMLAVTLLILAATVFVLSQVSSGTMPDLTRLKSADTKSGMQDDTMPETSERTAEVTAAQTPVRTATPTAAAEAPQAAKTVTLTVAGTVSLSGEVRKNSYFSDVKQYDYYDTMTRLRKIIRGDLNIVFLENLLTEETKATDITATTAGAAMLKAAGFNAAACGFSNAFDKAESGITETRKVLNGQGILALGIYESADMPHFLIRETNGIRIALLQYTETISSGTRKNMARNEKSGLVPAADAETVAADIREAKTQGAEVILVLMNWGKTGKAPDKTMRTLAQQIADAGADLIVGNGSRIVSGAEMLTAAEDGRQVLCVWSLGTVLSGDRSNIRRIAGILLEATVWTENGTTVLTDYRYTPLYTWKYKQDGRYQYRCVAADGSIPDGMDSEQQKMIRKAAETVQNAMKDSPVEENTSE